MLSPDIYHVAKAQQQNILLFTERQRALTDAGLIRNTTKRLLPMVVGVMSNPNHAPEVTGLEMASVYAWTLLCGVTGFAVGRLVTREPQDNNQDRNTHLRETARHPLRGNTNIVGLSTVGGAGAGLLVGLYLALR